MKATPILSQYGQLIAISPSKHIQQHVTAQADEEFNKALVRWTKEIL